MGNNTVCFFNSTKSWGGGEKWHAEMSLQLFENKQQVLVVTHKKSELFNRLAQFEIPKHQISISNLSFLNIFKIIKIVLILRKYKVYTLIMNLPADLKVAGIAAKIARVKNIVYRRGSAIPIKKSIFNKLIFRYIVTDIITNTEATKKTINASDSALFPPSKINVLYNGLDLEQFDNQDIKNRHFKENSQLILGNLGRLVEQKAQYLLIDLAVLLKKQGLDFKILIGGEGKLEDKLKQYARDLNVMENIRFVGFVNNPKKFMCDIDIFVLTSKWEGFGYVLVEAMACNKPVVAFDISSNPEIIDNNITGYLVEWQNVEAMAERISYLALHIKDAIEMGKQGRKRVELLFNFKRNFASFQAFLLKKID